VTQPPHKPPLNLHPLTLSYFAFVFNQEETEPEKTLSSNFGKGNFAVSRGQKNNSEQSDKTKPAKSCMLLILALDVERKRKRKCYQK
jgi:hypothetical protein